MSKAKKLIGRLQAIASATPVPAPPLTAEEALGLLDELSRLRVAEANLCGLWLSLRKLANEADQAANGKWRA